MRVVVLLNEAAGSVAGLGAEMARIGDAFRAADVHAEIRAVEGGRIVDAALAAVASPDVDAVVAAGGDGTVSAVAQALAGAEKALGVLPLGTFNHFAKDAGIPLRLEKAVRAIAEGFVRTVDVAEVNGRTFVDNSVLGIYAAVVRARDVQRKRMGRNRWLALLRAAAGAMRRFPMLRVRFEGEGAWRRTPLVFIGNNDYELPLFPGGGRSSLERGRLCVYVASPASRLQMVAMALRALVGRLPAGGDLEVRRVPEITIDSRKRRLRVLVDGEIVYLRPPLRYRIRPRALRVLVPPPDGR